jgi:hypothetical protein
VEEIANDRLISVDVFVPGNGACLFVSHSIGFSLLDVWLFLLFVEIFTHEIKHRVDAFL